MREFTSVERQRIQFLTNLSIEMTYIEPRSTGLEKSIMDATAIIRDYLHAKKIHDYRTQPQGDKIIKRGYVVTGEKLVKTKVSLYRPKTKEGDPRIWFYKLHHYAKPNDILAIIANNSELFVINLTQLDVKLQYDRQNSPLYELINQLTAGSSDVAMELLKLLKTVALQPIPTVTDNNVDTGIGRTLESYLGIEMNSSKKPDYKGIELKSARSSRGKKRVQ
ncbi:MAG: MvaI/BcnI family restriction endonuclease, partial [Chloroflexota bacterium]